MELATSDKEEEKSTNLAPTVDMCMQARSGIYSKGPMLLARMVTVLMLDISLSVIDHSPTPLQSKVIVILTPSVINIISPREMKYDLDSLRLELFSQSVYDGWHPAKS